MILENTGNSLTLRKSIRNIIATHMNTYWYEMIWIYFLGEDEMESDIYNVKNGIRFGMEYNNE